MIVADGLERGLAALGMHLSEHQVEQLEQYLALLEKWNRVYNLTAIREPDRMVTHHLLDSLSIAPHMRGPRVLDVGSGAGLPGIPIAIARPAWQIVLLDSNQKKTAFLRQAIAELQLRNATVETQRIESWDTGQRFDMIVSRAFGEAADIVSASQRLLASSGAWVLMKGAYPRDELDRLPPGVRVKRVIELDVPRLDAERHLAILEAAA